MLRPREIEQPKRGFSTDLRGNYTVPEGIGDRWRRIHTLDRAQALEVTVSEPRLVHDLTHHHRRTLDQILAHPVSHNIEWNDILSLLGAVGSVDERHDGKFGITIGSETEVFERPPGKDIDGQQVLDLRRMLTNAGFSAASSVALGDATAAPTGLRDE